jgi:hypothetical protein
MYEAHPSLTSAEFAECMAFEHIDFNSPLCHATRDALQTQMIHASRGDKPKSLDVYFVDPSAKYRQPEIMPIEQQAHILKAWAGATSTLKRDGGKSK